VAAGSAQQENPISAIIGLANTIKREGRDLMDTEHPTPTSGEWKVRRVGTVTFAISKPKRSRRKLRQMRLKNRRRAR
jgi:hypothetical protein